MKKIKIQILTIVLLLPLIGACDTSDNISTQVIQTPQPLTSKEDNTDNSLALNQTCTNSNIGYQVNYPQGWQTNSGDVVNRCRVFDPHSAQVPQYTESIDKAVYLRVEKNVSFSEIAKEDISERHLSKQTTSIAGKKAVVIESESTGKALLRQGTRKYSYIVDLGNKTLIATTYDLPGSKYQQNKKILNRMMEKIQFKK